MYSKQHSQIVWSSTTQNCYYFTTFAIHRTYHHYVIWSGALPYKWFRFSQLYVQIIKHYGALTTR